MTNPIDNFVQMPQTTEQEEQIVPLKKNRSQSIANQFSCYIKAGIQLLVWSVIAVASLATGYVAVRAIWAAVKMVLTALGVEGGN